MNKKKSIRILVHIFTWLFLSLGYCFLAEPIAAYIFPGIHNVMIWLTVLLVGLILIFLGTLISLVVSLNKRITGPKTSVNCSGNISYTRKPHAKNSTNRPHRNTNRNTKK
jgi:hypothetical protein